MSNQTPLTSGFNLPGGRCIRKPILFALLTLLLVAAMILSGCQEPQTPSEELIAAARKVYTFDTFEASANFTIDLAMESEDPVEQAITELFNNSIFNFILKFDQKLHRYQVDFNLLYKGQNCGSLVLYLDLEKIALQSPFLGQKPICFYWEDSVPITSKYLNGMQIHIADYLPLLFSLPKELQEASYEAYSILLAEKVTVNQKKVQIALSGEGTEETFACKEYIVDLQTGDTLEKDYQEFLIAIFDNEKVRTKIKEKIEKFVEIAKNNGDLETWWWMEDEIKFLTENIDDYFNMMVESFAEEEELFELPTDQMEVDYRIYIDDSGLFRNMVFSQILPLTEEESPIPASINSTIKMDMFNYGKQLNFTEFDPVGAFDAGKASMEEWTALGEEVMMKAIEELMFNPLFQDIMLLSSMIEESEE